MVLWGLRFPSCHCFPFISVRGTHTQTALTHTSCGTKAFRWTVSELGAGGAGRVLPPHSGSRAPGSPQGRAGRDGAMLGDSVSQGGGGLNIGFLATSRAASSPFQPAVGLKG